MHKQLKFVIISVIIIFILIVTIDFLVKQSRKEFCLNSDLIKEEVFYENLGFNVNVTKCPEGCVLSSCYGIKTVCCPKGLFN